MEISAALKITGLHPLTDLGGASLLRRDGKSLVYGIQIDGPPGEVAIVRALSDRLSGPDGKLMVNPLATGAIPEVLITVGPNRISLPLTE
jgi:hypothetical protein